MYRSVMTCVLFLGVSVLSFGQDPAAPGPAEGAAAPAPAAKPAPSGEVPASCSSIQALLYPDVASIMRIETQRIDFEGLETFAQDFVQYGIGSFKIDDRYLVKLRENQKMTLKQRIVDYLELLRARYAQTFWANGVNEYFRIRYVNGQDFCNCVAVPLGGMSETGIAAIEKYLEQEYAPIVIFKRFGFIIAVDDHSSKLAAPGEEKEGEEEEEDEEEDDTTAGGGGSLNAARAKAKRERERYLKARLQATSPAIRRRFFVPAKLKKGDESVAVALAATNGAAITYVMKDADAVLEMANWLVLNGIELPMENLQSTIEANKAKFKWMTFNVSLVGAPRVILLAQFSDGATSLIFSALVKGMLDGLKTSINTKLDEQVKELELLKDKFEKNPFGPILDVLFDSIQPVAKGSQVALILNSAHLLDNAPAFVPLFGGVSAEMPAKKPGEADTEDMFGDEGAPAGGKPAAKASDKPPASKPAAAPAEPKKTEPAKPAKDDDPFA